MRLENVAHGHRPAERIALERMREETGMFASDISRTVRYRPELFGDPFLEALEEVMRGPSDWSVGERELFAAFVSAQNQCPF